MDQHKLAAIILLSMLYCSTAATTNQEQRDLDRIVSLPGQPPVEFSQFSGYVGVNEERGRALFYWLTEATTDARVKPLVLWLTGGPGCSSIAFGADEKLGPFRVAEDGSSLRLTRYSWNRVANILFLETPAGVGYSYTNTTSDLLDSGDRRTAQDSFIFLRRWMRRFPEYKGRDFYIAGESYAGNYVPQLARKIYRYNMNHSSPVINLKGFIVGNAIIDNNNDYLGAVTYWWSHSLISDTTYKRILKLCDFRTRNISQECNNTLNYAQNQEFGSIDPYSIYTPTCNASSSPLRNTKSPIPSIFDGYDPCSYIYSEAYFNRPDVQRALHANTTGIPYTWTGCSTVLASNWKDSELSMYSTYKKLIAAGLRIWVFSGDMDAVVPVTSTRFSLNGLNLTIKEPWRPWYSGGQVGGWTEVYEGLTFATVRAAGHEVSLFQPERGFDLFRAFLSGEDLPIN